MNILNDDEYLNMQMECIGIIQCIIDEHRISGLYTCSECKVEISCESAVWSHILNHFNIRNNILIADLWACMTCGIEFNSADQLNEHNDDEHNAINTVHSDDDDDAEDIDEQNHHMIDRRFECKICNIIYDTSESLNDHIFDNHFNYNDLLALDNKSTSDTFPGYDILVHIKMIHYIEKNIGMKKNIKECCLCYEQYNDFSRSKCTLDNSEKNKKKVFRCDQMIGRHSEYYQKKKQIVAIEMKCCKANLCTDCLKNHLNMKENLICPFCNKNHTQYDKRFIIFDERPSDKIKKNPDPYPLNVKTKKKDESKYIIFEETYDPIVQSIGVLYRQLEIDFKDNIDTKYSDMSEEQMFEYYQLMIIQQMNEQEDKLQIIEQELINESKINTIH